MATSTSRSFSTGYGSRSNSTNGKGVRRELDDPPFSRLFVLGSKETTKEQFVDAFEKFGTIQDVTVLKDKQKNENKGIAYIKFQKASEAALALEEMGGQQIKEHPKPLKVFFASEKGQSESKDPNKEVDRIRRLFVTIPKTYSKQDLEDTFQKFGEIDNVHVVLDKSSKQPKGCGFVSFIRAYNAAIAMETCDSEFNAQFAQPKPSGNEQGQNSQQNDYGYGGGAGVYHDGSYPSMYGQHSSSQRGLLVPPAGGSTMMDTSSSDYNYPVPYNANVTLQVMLRCDLTQEQVSRLFDLVPGMEYCEMNDRGFAYVRYQSLQWASYAKDKFHGFEYPIGCRIQVRFLEPMAAGGQYSGYGSGMYDKSYEGSYDSTSQTQTSQMSQPAQSGTPPPPPGGASDNPSLQGCLHHLAETLKQTNTVLKQAGIAGASEVESQINKAYEMLAQQSGGGSASSTSSGQTSYCSATLPAPQPVAPQGTECVERLFVVTQPQAVPISILQDAFSRFGNMINASYIPGRNFGYVRFASSESAQKAMETLNDQKICGMKLRVQTADPPKDKDNGESARKRPRT